MKKIQILVVVNRLLKDCPPGTVLLMSTYLLCTTKVQQWVFKTAREKLTWASQMETEEQTEGKKNRTVFIRTLHGSSDPIWASLFACRIMS